MGFTIVLVSGGSAAIIVSFFPMRLFELFFFDTWFLVSSALFTLIVAKASIAAREKVASIANVEFTGF